MAIYNSSYTGAEVDASVAKTQAITKTPQEINNLNQVNANPTLVGTEPDLTGLQVGNAKYKVSSGGGNLYIETISIRCKIPDTSSSANSRIFINIITENIITSLNDLCAYINNRGVIDEGLSSTTHFILATGYQGTTRIVNGIGYDSSLPNQFRLILMSVDGSIGATTLNVLTSSVTNFYYNATAI